MRDRDVYLKRDDGSFRFRVSALVIRDRKLLVAKSKDYPNYHTVGGAVRLHETSQEAVVREFFEETGYRIEVDRLLWVEERFFSLGAERYHAICLFYLLKANDDMVIAENSHTDQSTSETLHWIALDDLPRTGIVPSSIKSFDFDHLADIKHIISRE